MPDAATSLAGNIQYVTIRLLSDTLPLPLVTIGNDPCLYAVLQDMLRYVMQFAYIVNDGSSVLQPILNIITM